MKNILVLTLLAFLTLVFTQSAKSQERQVHIDKEGKLDVIDSDLEKKLGFFSDYNNFQEARLYLLTDTSFVLEIFYQLDDMPLKMRLPLSETETIAFREKVSKRIGVEAPQAILDQEGRTKLIITSTILSLGYYGWVVPTVSEVNDGKIFLALYMLTSGTGFFLPLSLTSNIPVTDAAASLYSYGATRGIVHGMYLNRLLVGEESTSNGLITLGMLGSIAEAIAGFSIASKLMMQPGTASTIGVGGDFGLGLGMGAANVANLFDDGKKRSAAATILVGSTAGLLAGNWFANDQHYTRGDAYVLEGAGIIGGYLPMVLLDIAGVEGSKKYVAASMAGSVIGLGVAHNYLVNGKDFTTGQGVMIELSEFAGALVGLGFGYLLSSNGDNTTILLTSSALGASAGFGFTYSAFAKTARGHEEVSSWKLNFSPVSFFTSSVDKKDRSLLHMRSPIISVGYQF